MVVLLGVLSVFFITLSSVSAGLLEGYFYTGEEPGAAAHARGLTYLAHPAGGYAPFWNPASLAREKRQFLAFSSNVVDIDSENLPDSLDAFRNGRLNYLALVGPEVGLYWRNLSSFKDVEDENQDNYRDVRMNLMGVAIGIDHAQNIDFGMNINFLHGTVGFVKKDGAELLAEVPYGYGWSLDWGLIYHIFDNFKAGVSLKNAPGAMYWDKGFGRDRLPVSFRGGINISMSNLMSFGVEYEKWFSDGSIKPGESAHLGVEHFLSKQLVLRAGIYGKNLSKEAEAVYTAGLGYSLDSFSMDIAVRQYGSDLKAGRRFSISAEIPL
ncbi:MAG: hypothetical protein GX817_06065 [Elusimicrobia bacterium]|nr:hypothetical protein [Elusimicrobiota bacterium]